MAEQSEQVEGGWQPAPRFQDFFSDEHHLCPYCLYESGDTWELFTGRMDDDTTVTCGGCEREYTVERRVEVTYVSRPLEVKRG